MALDFVFEGFGEVAKRVEILDLDLGAEILGPAQAHADVGVTAERTFFHVAITHTSIEKDLAKRGEVSIGLVGRAHVRLGNNFAKGRAAAIEVHVGFIAGLRQAFVEGTCRHLPRDGGA